MTAYGFTNSQRVTLPSNTAQEKKDARKKQLETVFQRRRENYLRWQKKMQLQADGEVI